MINIEKTKNTVELQIFDFDLPHFVENHLDTAISDVHELRSKLSNNGKFPCRMGFVVTDKLHQYQDNLNSAHFRIGFSLDYQSNCLAMKPKYTYHVTEQMNDRDIAIALLNSYINWLNKQIKQVQKYAKKLVFSKLIVNVIPKGMFPSTLGEVVSRYRVDSVYTRKSLLDLISQNITAFYKQMLNNNDIDYYNNRYYLDWLLTDKHLREYFMLKMLTLPDLQQLVQSNSNLVETMLQVCQFNFDDMEHNLLSKGRKLAPIASTFASVILPMLEPITDTLPKSYEHAMHNNWETYNYDNLKLLARLENYFHKAYFTFPVSFINDLAYYETGYLSMLHLQLLNSADLNYLLNNGFKTSDTFETMQDTLVYNDDFTSRIINLINRSVIDLNGNRQLILNWLSKLKHKSKKHNLTNIEYNQMDILRSLLK